MNEKALSAKISEIIPDLHEIAENVKTRVDLRMLAMDIENRCAIIQVLLEDSTKTIFDFEVVEHDIDAAL